MQLSVELAERQKGTVDFPQNAIVGAILPSVLNTAANRKAMKGSDRKEWDDPDDIAMLIKQWGVGEGRPENGAFVEFSKELNGKLIMPQFA